MSLPWHMGKKTTSHIAIISFIYKKEWIYIYIICVCVFTNKSYIYPISQYQFSFFFPKTCPKILWRKWLRKYIQFNIKHKFCHDITPRLFRALICHDITPRLCRFISYWANNWFQKKHVLGHIRSSASIYWNQYSNRTYSLALYIHTCFWNQNSRKFVKVWYIYHIFLKESIEQWSCNKEIRVLNSPVHMSFIIISNLPSADINKNKRVKYGYKQEENVRLSLWEIMWQRPHTMCN